MNANSFFSNTKSSQYQNRINKCIDFIECHLHDKISLKDLSQISGFSLYHFHRIFAAFMEEPLYAFVQRLRIERAASLLLTRVDKSLTQIALDCGFSDAAAFSRAFKKKFSCSPSTFKKNKNSKIVQALSVKKPYNNRMQSSIEQEWAQINLAKHLLPNVVSVKEVLWEATDWLYMRQRGKYAGDEKLFQSLYQKFTRQLQNIGKEKILKQGCAIFYHDGIEISNENFLRISMAAKTKRKEFLYDTGILGIMSFPRQKILQCRFELQLYEYAQAWQKVYQEILPQYGVLPADFPPFEFYAYDCCLSDRKSVQVEICIPLERVCLK